MVNTMSAQPAVATTQSILLDTSAYSVLAGAAFFMGMSTAAFTKAGKGKRAGAKAGFTFAGLFFLASTGMLIYVAAKVLKEQSDEKKS